MTIPSFDPLKLGADTGTDGCCAAADTADTGTARRVVSATRRAVLSRRVRLLVAATITYNIIEAAVALVAGTVASSAALIGFGLDSVIEVASATTVAWQFSGANPEARERAALRVIAVSFFALAGYVAVEALRSLFGVSEAAPSTVGIVLAAVSLLVMPFLSYAQRRAGRDSARPVPSPTPSRPCCALTCPGCCCSASYSTACSAGRGLTQWWHSSSLPLPSRKAGGPGVVSTAAD